MIGKKLNPRICVHALPYRLRPLMTDLAAICSVHVPALAAKASVPTLVPGDLCAILPQVRDWPSSCGAKGT